VKLVTPDGGLREISETQDAHLLPFIRSHFGLFGVVCEITLRVFKNQPLLISYEAVEAEHFLESFSDQLRRLKAAHDQVFGMLFPHSRKLLWQCRKFVEPDHPPNVLERLTSAIQSKGINVFKDVLLPLVKAGTPKHSPHFADLLSRAVIELPMGVFSHGSYMIDPCDRGIIYRETDPHFDFYDWVFPEDRWCEMIRAFLDLEAIFRQDRRFSLPLPTLIYFIKHDQASLLSRSRSADMIAVDPTYPDPDDEDWKAFRLEFNKIAMSHGGVPHINKTHDGAVNHFAASIDADTLQLFLQKRREFDPKDLFLNDFFRRMFSIGSP
jgi:FAD/FMN-containing dehydrogenase